MPILNIDELNNNIKPIDQLFSSSYIENKTQQNSIDKLNIQPIQNLNPKKFKTYGIGQTNITDLDFWDLTINAGETGIESITRRLKTGFVDERYAIARFAKTFGVPIPEKKLQTWKQEKNIQVTEWPLKIAGKVNQLLALHQLLAMTPLPTNIAQTISELGFNNKFFMADTLYNSVVTGAKYGIGGAIDEVSKILSGDEEISSNLITTPLKETAFGLSLGAVHGLKNIPARTILSGLNRGTWSLLNSKLQDNKIDKKDIYTALTAFGIGAIAEGLGSTREFIYTHKSHNLAQDWQAINEKVPSKLIQSFRDAKRMGDISTMENIATKIGELNPRLKDNFLNLIPSRGEVPIVSDETKKIVNNVLLNKGVSLDKTELNKLTTILSSDNKLYPVAEAIAMKSLPIDVYNLSKVEQTEILKKITYNVSHNNASFDDAVVDAVKDIPAKKIPSAINKFIKTPFIEKDVMPSIKKTISFGENIADSFKKTFAPIYEATEEQRNIAIKNLGEKKFEDKLLLEQTTKWNKLTDSWNDEKKLIWNYYKEKGQIDKIENEDERNLAFFVQGVADGWYDSLKDIKKIGYINNYLPHIVPEKIFPYLEKDLEAEGIVFNTSYYGKKPLGGNAHFTKERIFETQIEGKLSGVQYIENPIEAVNIMQTQVSKFISVHNMINDCVESGHANFFTNNESIPEGWRPINETLSKKYLKLLFEKTDLANKNLYMDENMARLVENYASENKWLKNPYTRMIHKANQIMNISNLSFSTFHLGVTNGNAMAVTLGMALEDLSQGKIVSSFKNAFISPIAGPASYLKGKGLIDRSFKGDETALAQMRNYYEGGGTIGLPEEMEGYLKSLKQALKDKNYLGAIPRIALAGMEYSLKPLMKYYIPAIKVGMYQEILSRNLELYKDSKSFETINRMSVNNVEWLFGKMNMDNFFWDNTTKSTLQSIFRSTSWNIGTLSTFAKGIYIDPPKVAWDFIHGKDTKITRDMWNVAGIVMATVLAGGIYHFLHTGESPKEFKDYVFPKSSSDKDAKRVTVPGYGKELIFWHTYPIRTLKVKAAPLLTAAYRTLNNENFYGDYISNPNDPVSIQFLQRSKYLIDAMVPFSYQQYKRSKEQNESFLKKVESFGGIIEARSVYQQSKIEKEIFKRFKQQMQGDFKAFPEAEDLRGQKNLARLNIVKNGDFKLFNKLRIEGKIKNPRLFIRNAHLTGTQRAFKHLSLKDKLELFNQMSIEEKQKYSFLLKHK